jgi:hypothetical protein
MHFKHSLFRSWELLIGEKFVGFLQTALKQTSFFKFGEVWYYLE